MGSFAPTFFAPDAPQPSENSHGQHAAADEVDDHQDPKVQIASTHRRAQAVARFRQLIRTKPTRLLSIVNGFSQREVSCPVHPTSHACVPPLNKHGCMQCMLEYLGRDSVLQLELGNGRVTVDREVHAINTFFALPPRSAKCENREL